MQGSGRDETEQNDCVGLYHPQLDVDEYPLYANRSCGWCSIMRVSCQIWLHIWHHCINFCRKRKPGSGVKNKSVILEPLKRCYFKTVLTHVNPDLPVILACDSSSYGLGAVLSQLMPDRSKIPVIYELRLLTTTERKFTQIEKEALGLYWGVRKFPSYLEGHCFTLITDHKPLKYIMDPSKAVPVTTAA